MPLKASKQVLDDSLPMLRQSELREAEAQPEPMGVREVSGASEVAIDTSEMAIENVLFNSAVEAEAINSNDEVNEADKSVRKTTQVHHDEVSDAVIL